MKSSPAVVLFVCLSPLRIGYTRFRPGAGAVNQRLSCKPGAKHDSTWDGAACKFSQDRTTQFTSDQSSAGQLFDSALSHLFFYSSRDPMADQPPGCEHGEPDEGILHFIVRFRRGICIAFVRTLVPHGQRARVKEMGVRASVLFLLAEIDRDDI